MFERKEVAEGKRVLAEDAPRFERYRAAGSPIRSTLTDRRFRNIEARQIGIETGREESRP